MNHTNSGTCNTREEETEGKEREKQASKQAEERIGNREETNWPTECRYRDVCLLGLCKI
jgi:hypothetical protein